MVEHVRDGIVADKLSPALFATVNSFPQLFIGDKPAGTPTFITDARVPLTLDEILEGKLSLKAKEATSTIEREHTADAEEKAATLLAGHEHARARGNLSAQYMAVGMVIHTLAAAGPHTIWTRREMIDRLDATILDHLCPEAAINLLRHIYALFEKDVSPEFTSGKTMSDFRNILGPNGFATDAEKARRSGPSVHDDGSLYIMLDEDDRVAFYGTISQADNSYGLKIDVEVSDVLAYATDNGMKLFKEVA